MVGDTEPCQLAEDPACPPDLLERLALDVAERVRAAAAPGPARWKLPKAP